MRVLLAMSLLALMGCAGSKPVAIDNENPKCKDLILISAENQSLLRELINGIEYRDENGEIMGKCHCVSTITCNETNYCSTEECPWGTFSSLDSIAMGVR